MNDEIEKLIDLALTDGQLTEKEKTVIINKAAALGIDRDEIELILEGKIQQLELARSKSTKEKVGNIKTCPACGASAKSFKTNCEECGHEYSKVKDGENLIDTFNNGLYNLPKTIIGLIIICPHCKSKLKLIQEADRTSCPKCKKIFETGGLTKIDNIDNIINYINSFVVPNDKESNLTFLMYILSKLRITDRNFNDGLIKSAFKGKADELIQRCLFLFSNDNKLSELLKNLKVELEVNYKKNFKGNKLKSLFWISSSIFAMLTILYFLLLAFVELEKFQIWILYAVYITIIIFWLAISINFYKFKNNQTINF